MSFFFWTFITIGILAEVAPHLGGINKLGSQLQFPEYLLQLHIKLHIILAVLWLHQYSITATFKVHGPLFTQQSLGVFHS